MLKKNLLVFLAIVSLSCGGLMFSSSAPAADKVNGTRVIAYYFHGNQRCPTCRNLEQYSKEALETNFEDAFASGKLEFKAVNVEEKANEHYAGEYQLYTKSLVLSSVKDGRQIRWKNLDKIWEYVRNKQRFFDYVKSETGLFMKDSE